MKIDVAALETLRKAEGFNAVMIGTIILLGGTIWLAAELLETVWLATDEFARRAVVGLIIVLMICCSWIALRWQNVKRVAFKSKHIFIGLPSLSDEPFHVQVLNGIVQQLASEYTVTLWLPDESQEYQGGAFEEFLSTIKNDSAMYAGGIILPTVVDHERPERLAELSKEINLPVVLVDTLPEVFVSNRALPPGHDFIGFDNVEGGRKAAQAMAHELDKTAIRPKRVLILHAKEQKDRYDAFIAELSKIYPGVICDQIECGWRRDKSREALTRLAKAGSLEKYDGIFGCNDEMAIGAIEALSEISNSGSDWRDTVIIGYDGSPTASTLLRLGGTQLRNVVVQDGYSLGTKAAARLRRLIQKRHSANDLVVSEPVLLEPELYYRNL